MNEDFSSLGELFQKQLKRPKPPAYKWQDLALRVINELKTPPFKRGAVFKVCKANSEEVIMRALNDTKELAKGGEAWKYFFKILAKPKSAASDE